METSKPCRKCGTDKSLVLFAKDKRTADGREGVCKDCRNAARQKRATHESTKTLRRIKPTSIIIKPVAEEDELIQRIEDEIDLIEKMKKKHSTTYFSVSSHPHLDGFVVQLNKPRFHSEGKNLRSMLIEALALPSIQEAM